MYIRQTKTGTSSSGDIYYTFRIVTSQRVNGKVRQKTLLNLGRYFSLDKDQWPNLCMRIEEILAGQLPLFSPDEEIEELAQKYAAQIIANHSLKNKDDNETKEEYQEVDINSLHLVRPRSIGVEHVGLEALNWLQFTEILKEIGLNGKQQAAVLGAVIGRMAHPASELSTWHWLRQESGLGELLNVDYENFSLMSMYRASDLLVRHRKEIEDALFANIKDIFSLSETVTLYDLTNTYFEGQVSGNSKAARGHSKEKRTDCPLVTLGVVLDGNGFIRRSKMFAGNIVEGTTLEEMLKELNAAPGAMVIMDRGIATQANIDWLVENKYRYIVVSRERNRQFDADKAVELNSSSNHTIQIHRVENEEKTEARLYCYSQERAEKEKAITNRLCNRFEQGLKKIAEGLNKPRGTKRHDKVLEKIGRLKGKNRGISRHYHIDLEVDKKQNRVIGLTWQKKPAQGSMLSHPGVYCLRTNEMNWDEEKLWRTYIMLTDVEAVFRCLKSELGLRPIYHHKEERTEGHLFITVIAYQAVQAIRQKLKSAGNNASWNSLRKILQVQRRITATFKTKDGRTLHVRKASIAEPQLKTIYDALKIFDTPGGVTKMIHDK